MAKRKYSGKSQTPASPAKPQETVQAAKAAEAEEKLVPEGRGGRLSLSQQGDIVLYSGKRLPIIDNARGVIMLGVLIIGFGFIQKYSSPFFYHHSFYPGVGIRDMLTPILLLTLAFTMELSFQKRAAAKGVKAAVSHGVKRGFTYIVMGLVLDEFLGFVHLKESVAMGAALWIPAWNIFQSIGAGIVTASLCLRLKTKHKLLIIVALLAIPYIVQLIYPETVDYWNINAAESNEARRWGGIFSFFSFGALLIGYNVLTKLAFSNFKRYLIVYAAIVALAVVCIIATPTFSELQYMFNAQNALTADGNLTYMTFLKEVLHNPLIINFPTISFGYIAFGTALGATILLIMVLLNYLYDRDIPLISSLGKNSLLFFILFSVTAKPMSSMVYANWFNFDGTLNPPLYVPIVYTACMTALFCGIAYILDRKKWYFKL
ncbi:MAG: hypothetical protein LBQ40_01365 [Clostridiales bacterium]|jgi:hypothetical protein|nr:hypothetical protein [Clostridiales bacterium]